MLMELSTQVPEETAKRFFEDGEVPSANCKHPV